MRPWNLILGSNFLSLTGIGVISENVLYVDSETGNDTTGDGTADNPFMTLNKAASIAANTTYIVCRGYFDENVATSQKAFVADREFDTVYAGPMPTSRGKAFNMYNNWIFYYSNFYGNKGYDWTVCGFMKDVGQKYFAVKNNRSVVVCSSYKQNVTLSTELKEAYYARTGCIEQATVYILTYNFLGYFVLKNCIIYIDGNLFTPEGETDEEQTLSLQTRLKYSNVKITSGPLFNDPENGDLTLHPDSVALQSKIYLNSNEYIYPAAFPPALSVKILPNSTGEKYAFDERTISENLFISDEKTIEPIRDDLGDILGSGYIDSKVITFKKGTTLRGLNIVFDNDELNAGLRLGKQAWQTLQVRFKQSISYTSNLNGLIQGAVYLNSNAFDVVLKNSISNAERIIVSGESFILKANEIVFSSEADVRLGIVFTNDSGWMDCLCNNDLFVKRVSDVAGGAMDTDADGNILTNANPNSYSEENASRPDFPVSAKYVQYRLNINKNDE